MTNLFWTHGQVAVPNPYGSWCTQETRSNTLGGDNIYHSHGHYRPSVMKLHITCIRLSANHSGRCSLILCLMENPVELSLQEQRSFVDIDSGGRIKWHPLFGQTLLIDWKIKKSSHVESLIITRNTLSCRTSLATSLWITV